MLVAVLAFALWGLRPSPGPAPVVREATEALLDVPGRRLLAALRYAIKDRWILYPLISSDRLLRPVSRSGLPAPAVLDFVLGFLGQAVQRVVQVQASRSVLRRQVANYLAYPNQKR